MSHYETEQNLQKIWILTVRLYQQMPRRQRVQIKFVDRTTLSIDHVQFKVFQNM